MLNRISPLPQQDILRTAEFNLTDYAFAVHYAPTPAFALSVAAQQWRLAIALAGIAYLGRCQPAHGLPLLFINVKLFEVGGTSAARVATDRVLSVALLVEEAFTADELL